MCWEALKTRENTLHISSPTPRKAGSTLGWGHGGDWGGSVSPASQAYIWGFAWPKCSLLIGADAALLGKSSHAGPQASMHDTPLHYSRPVFSIIAWDHSVVWHQAQVWEMTCCVLHFHSLSSPGTWPLSCFGLIMSRLHMYKIQTVIPAPAWWSG